jgi:hypothetical protein
LIEEYGATVEAESLDVYKVTLLIEEYGATVEAESLDGRLIIDASN